MLVLTLEQRAVEACVAVFHCSRDFFVSHEFLLIACAVGGCRIKWIW